MASKKMLSKPVPSSLVFISSLPLPLHSFLSSSAPQAERSALHRLVCTNAKFCYVSPSYPTLSTSNSASTSLYPLPPFSQTMDNLRDTYARIYGGGEIAGKVVTGPKGASFARSLVHNSSVDCLELLVDNNDNNNQQLHRKEAYWRSGVWEEGGDVSNEGRVKIGKCYGGELIGVDLSGDDATYDKGKENDFSKKLLSNDAFFDAVLNVLSQSVVAIKNGWDKDVIGESFHEGKGEVWGKCKEVWEEWDDGVFDRIVDNANKNRQNMYK